MSKFTLLAELVLEFFIFLYELYKLHNLERHSINMVVRYSEKDRRKMFAAKYTCFVTVWLVIMAVSSAVVHFLATVQTCGAGQATEWGQICSNCQVEHCEECALSPLGKDGCDTCSIGYALDTSKSVCEDASCRLTHCEECQESGVFGCDRCFDGYRFNQMIGAC